ncbi:MAG: hypothetical protein V2A78_07075 [bacterium]
MKNAVAVLTVLLLTIWMGFSSAFCEEAAAPTIIQITGRPASAEFVAQVLKERLGIQVPVPGPLDVNQRLNIEFPAQPGSDVGKTVTIENYDLPILDPTFLMFSNYPEKVKERGLLFSGGLIRHQPVRFQYYHLGHPESPGRFLLLRLYNPGETSARLHVVRGCGGPSGDFMKEGHLNSLEFLSRFAGNEGEILTVEAHSSLDLASIPLPSGEVVSGTYQIHLLDGPPLGMYLFSVDDEKQSISYPSIIDSKDPHATGVYPIANFYMRDAFRSAEKEKYLTIGDFSLQNYLPQKSLAGAYGCVYNIQMKLQNPGPEAVEIQILFQPRGGHATATFLIGDEIIPVGFTRVGKEVLLRRIPLQPGEEKDLTIRTMPEGASFYPVRLIFRSQ